MIPTLILPSGFKLNCMHDLHSQCPADCEVTNAKYANPCWLAVWKGPILTFRKLGSCPCCVYICRNVSVPPQGFAHQERQNRSRLGPHTCRNVSLLVTALCLVGP